MKRLHVGGGNNFICDNSDLAKYNLHLHKCCEGLDMCEDVLLHSTLHAQNKPVNVAGEKKLRAEMLQLTRSKKDDRFKGWKHQFDGYYWSRYENLVALQQGVRRGDMISDPAAIHLLSRTVYGHISVYGCDSVWSTVRGSPDCVPLRFVKMANGQFRPVAFGDAEDAVAVGGGMLRCSLQQL